MTIGVLTLIIFIPCSNSLKDKRSILKRLKNRLIVDFNVCVAEVDCQDKWQKAVLALGFINNNRATIDSTFSKIVNFMGSDANFQLLDYRQELL
ncbi:MAG: DUF503 domain-containing protein [Candidatus Omnitrophota bacterium]